MDKKTIAIIITVVACLLCVCPGISGMFGGGLFAIISFIPGADIDIFGSPDPSEALNFGLTTLGVSLVLVVIGAVAIFLAWKKKKNA